MTAPRHHPVIEPTGSEIQVVAKLASEDVIAVIPRAPPVQPGDKIRLRPIRVSCICSMPRVAND